LFLLFSTLFEDAVGKVGTYSAANVNYPRSFLRSVESSKTGDKMKNHRLVSLFLISLVVSVALPSSAQQKGQYTPGQYGLNAGVAIMPSPGFTVANLDLNYSANALKDSNGSALPVKGTYSFWVVENLFFYVPEHKILGGKFSSWAALNWANGSVNANIP